MTKPRVRILIVDDDEAVCTHIRDLLEDATTLLAVVDGVTTPEDAFAALKRGRYDLLILDQNLGATSGLELLKKLRKQKRMQPVIMMSGFGQKDMGTKARKAGAADYIPKSDLSLATLERAILLATRAPLELGSPATGLTGMVAADGDLGVLLRQVLKLNSDFVRATSRNTQELRALNEGISGMRGDITQGFTTLEMNIQEMQKAATTDHEETQRTLMEQIKISNDFDGRVEGKLEALGPAVEKAIANSRRHVTIKVLDWVKENKMFSLSLAIAFVFFVLLAVIVSQTLKPDTFNQLRGPSRGAPEARPPQENPK